MYQKVERVLITGASGMLGKAFQKMLMTHYPKIEVKALSKNLLDVSNYDAVIALALYKPNIIIHCAAIVNADYCEKNYDEAYLIMVGGTQNIIKLAHMCNAKLVYPQSFLIFDGTTNPVIEDTQPNPLSVYGELKYKSEEIIRAKANSFLIIRMGGFFGGEEKDKNFVGKIVPEILSRVKNSINEIEVGDRVWQPTYTEDLALNSLALIMANKQGIYNMASHNESSFYDFTVKIVEYLNLAHTMKVIKVSSQQFDNIENAKRPHYVKLINKRLIEESLDMQGNWEISLKKYLSSDYFKTLLNS